MSVEKTAGGETVSLTGNVQAQTEVNLSFRIDGRVIQRNVDVGATVKPGQVIATLNADNEENSLQSARSWPPPERNSSRLGTTTSRYKTARRSASLRKPVRPVCAILRPPKRRWIPRKRK
jgi:multidrug efflux pump subunit AcrA (membrane-fusion protein)